MSNTHTKGINMPIDLTIARTIIEQLGGRFSMMTGAKNFVGNNTGVTFKIGGGAKNGINCVRITLTPMDDYTLEFMRIWGTKVKEISKIKGVYNDNLQKVFTAETGFDTNL